MLQVRFLGVGVDDSLDLYSQKQAYQIPGIGVQK